VGILIAVASGILSAMLNIGFALGSPLAESARLQGHSGVLATLAIWVPALGGGLAVNLVYTGLLIHHGRRWSWFYSVAEAGQSWTRCLGMGLLWFGAIFAYGYGASLMGTSGTVYGWAMTAGGSILTSNAWGAATGEWQGAGGRAKILMVMGTVLLLLSFVLVTVQRTHQV
jgi:L-rhamnose-H+ transport protein